MQKELTGFILNRLQAALWREAFHLVLSGACTVEDVGELTFVKAHCTPIDLFHRRSIDFTRSWIAVGIAGSTS